MIFDAIEGKDAGEDFVRLGRSEVDALFVQAMRGWDKRDAQIGDTIPAEWFYELLGVLHPAHANSFERAEAARQSFMTVFHGRDGFRTFLLKHRKRYLKTNYAGGYEVLDPKEQTAFARKQRRNDINKALREEMSLLENVDTTDLSATERKENADAIAHSVALAKILHRRKPGFDNDKKR